MTTTPRPPDTLVSGLRHRIAELHRLADAASPGPWIANAERDTVTAVDGVEVATVFALSNNQLRATTAHIVANNPDAILGLCAEVMELLAMYPPAPRIVDRPTLQLRGVAPLSGE